MDIRQLRYFVSVAHYENIAKAAMDLCISQSPLSRQIRALEKDIGCELFNRYHKRLVLNDIGKEFLSEATVLISRFDDLHGFKNRYNNNIIKIGYVDSVIFGEKFQKILHFLKIKNVEANIFSMKTKNQMSFLKEGQIDIALIYRINKPDRYINFLDFEEDILSLAVPLSHPLAARKKITVDDLKDAIWIAQPRLPNVTGRETFLEACHKAGFSPNICFEASTPLSVIALVEKGFGIGLLQKRMADTYAHKVKLFDLEWFPMRVRTSIAWRQDETSSLIKDLVRKLSGQDCPIS